MQKGYTRPALAIVLLSQQDYSVTIKKGTDVKLVPKSIGGIFMKKTWSKVLATVLVLAMVLCMPGFAASVDTVDYDADHAASADELTDADLPELLSSDGNHYPTDAP